MGSFTIRFGSVLDSEGDSGDGRKIGLSDYPIPNYWTETDRTALNQKIIGHYIMREIGQETVGLFCHFLRQRMWEIMPPYVQLYESTQLEFDPILSVKLETTRTDHATEITDRSGTSNVTNTNNTKGRTVSSTTPNTMLEGDGNYADNAVDSNSDTSGESDTSSDEKGNVTNDGNVTSSTSGFQGSPSDLLRKYRETILSIDMMVVAALYDMFMLVWDNTTEMLPEHGRGYSY